ncbi:MAG: InlB B-repeat-containing protein [Oscillospiraceae bacterium]|nr:InlB B-repeat-containing protein [Oscillospiraceae bacterium]
MKKIVSSILAFIMSCGLCFGTASAEEPEAAGEPAIGELSLKYDDRYTFQGAKTIEVENGDPTIEVLGNTIRAAGITETPVSVTVDGTVYHITVDKAAVAVFVIDGQSNAWGAAGRHDKAPITPDVGCGYFWINGGMMDANEYVKAMEKMMPRASVGSWPALAAEWYALTGEKAVVMNIAQNGAPIQHWTSGYYETGVRLIEECIDSIDTEMFTIAGGGYFWFQGESNSDIYESTNQMRYTTPEEYITEFTEVHNAYISAFASRGIKAFAGIFTIRTWGNLLGISKLNDYCGPRAAQQYLANSRSDIFIASSSAEEWDKSQRKAVSFTSLTGREVKVSTISALYNGVHYNQSGYDIMGLEAADSLYSGWFSGNQADDFVLYGQNGRTVYEEGSTIYLDDNLRLTGAANSGEKFAAQLVAVTFPRGDACSGMTMSLSRCSDGSEVTGVMTESGYIRDVTLIDEEMTLTVTMGELSRSYTVSKHQYKIEKGAESKKGSFSFTDRNGEESEIAGLGETVLVLSRAEEGYIPVGISVLETKTGKPVTSVDEGISDGTSVYSFRMPAADVTVKAKYLKPGTDNMGFRYTVEFDKNAEEATGSMRKMSATIGPKSALTPNAFEYEGYRFCGWNTAPDGSGTAIEDGAKVSDFVYYNNSSITLYAQWERIAVAEETADYEDAAEP